MIEQEMRDQKVPFFNTWDEVTKFVESLEADEYGKAAYAATLAAVAAFNYICHKEGLTGFQASCADLAILKHTRHIEGPYMIIDLDHYLFPQYDLRGKLEKFINDNKQWIKNEARKKIAESDKHNVHPDVMNRWKHLAEIVE